MSYYSSKPTGQNLWKTLFIGLVGVAIGWQTNTLWSDDTETSIAEEVDNAPADETVDLDLFWTVWNLIEYEYVNIDQVEEGNQVYGAIKGMVESLGDPYSEFLNPEETEQFQSSLDGELEGIGAELTVEEGLLLILSPIKNSPAEEAGLLPGDHIYMVDGMPTSEMTLWEAIMNIRGEPGTEVVLTIIREGEEEPLEVPITRQQIDVPSVELSYEEYGGSTYAQLAITQFGDDTYIEFEDAVREILLSDAQGIVLDLRMNGGGYLDASVNIMSEFFEDELTAVIVKERNNADIVHMTDGSGRLGDYPLVVLIDEGSASASEILAGALQDYERAVLLGMQSFGKGSVQVLEDFPDGSSLRITIAKWYTPLDRSIDDTGITPDIVVEMEPAEIDTENDVQLDAALDYLSTL